MQIHCGSLYFKRAFTLIDLLATLAIVAFLTLLVVPLFARNHSNVAAAMCLNNLRQFSGAWTLYNADNRGKLVWSYPNYQGANNTWCDGSSTVTAGSYNYDATDTNGLVAGKLWAYIKSASVYKCAADQRMFSTPSGVKPAVRSYSMNSYLGGMNFGDPMGSYNVNSGGTQGTYFRVYLKDSELRYPARTFLICDEDPISINDAMLIVNMGADPRGLIDMPSRLHDGGYAMNFTDGHATLQRFISQQTLTTTTMPVPGGNLNPDYMYLTNFATFPQL